MSEELAGRILAEAASPEDSDERLYIYDGWRELVDNPEWDKATRVHDWRRYIHPIAQTFWSELDIGARLLMYLQAEHQAGLEDWD